MGDADGTRSIVPGDRGASPTQLFLLCSTCPITMSRPRQTPLIHIFLPQTKQDMGREGPGGGSHTSIAQSVVPGQG